MLKLTFLGTANAIPSKEQQNSHLMIETEARTIMVDCGGNPLLGLESVGVDPLSITDLVLTHFHPDHVCGTPLLLMDLWLLGRETPLAVYGLADVLDRLRQMMELFTWGKWEGFYPISFNQLPATEYFPLIDDENLRVFSSPTNHIIPSIGLRIEYADRILCYSSDTGPCEAVIRLAQDADLLIHEATGNECGHSSAEQAGYIAQQAGVKKLYLIHYPTGSDILKFVEEAKKEFAGEVFAARDYVTISFD